MPFFKQLSATKSYETAYVEAYTNTGRKVETIVCSALNVSATGDTKIAIGPGPSDRTDAYTLILADGGPEYVEFELGVGESVYYWGPRAWQLVVKDR
ncbi:hypothetical protein SEA_BROPLEASE_2 [Streptomyces phage BroPlease]|nr:hypothetical protein SEA_BROPLEASE_2 [Streptomyces phage BroPlease]USH44920.1 hypothetical protein SEA_GREENWEASEL_2 [Streptomyces phage GreenWeasel]